jgi:hypothetical protein
VGTFTLPEAAAVGQFYALRLPLGGSLLRAQFQKTAASLRRLAHGYDEDARREDALALFD